MAHLSFRDPTTHILKAHGFIDANEPGDISQLEADDFALTPGLWAHPGATWDPYTPPPAPQPQVLLDTILAALGPSASNLLLTKYPLALQAIQVLPYNWAVFEALVIEAHMSGDITDEIYTLIRDTAVTTYVPIDLPALP